MTVIVVTLPYTYLSPLFFCLRTALIAGLGTARYSGCRIFIGGPDINPTLFYVSCAKIIVQHLTPTDGSPVSAADSASMAASLIFTIFLGTLIVAFTFLVLGTWLGLLQSAGSVLPEFGNHGNTLLVLTRLFLAPPSLSHPS